MLTATSWDTVMQNHSSNLHLDLWSKKLCGIISVYCFQLLNFGVIRYAPEGGNGNSLQYSCLENSMDRGAWWAIACDVTQSNTTEWLTHTQPVMQPEKMSAASQPIVLVYHRVWSAVLAVLFDLCCVNAQILKKDWVASYEQSKPSYEGLYWNTMHQCLL